MGKTEGEGRRARGEGTILEAKKLPDGRWQTRWRVRGVAPSGAYARRAGTTRGTKADARRAMQAARAEIEKGGAAAPDLKNLTVKQLLADWLVERGPHLRPRTRETYASHVRLHIEPHLGGLKVRALDAGTLQRFHRTLAADTEKKLGRTRQLIHGVLRQALDHAVVLGVLDHNPALVVRVPPPPPPRRLRLEDDGLVMAFDADAADRLYRLAMTDATPHGWAVALALALGLRRGEVFGARWQDADLQPRPDAPHGLLHIRQTLITAGKEDRISPPKTRRSRRTLRLNTKARAVLDAVKVWQAERAALPGWQPSGLIFTNETGGAERPNRSRDKLNRLQQQLWAEYRNLLHPQYHGQPDPPFLPYHALRHTFVSLAHQAGVPIEAISRVAGHSSVLVTELVYKHIFDKAAPLVSYSEERPWQEVMAEREAQRAEYEVA